LHRAVAPFPGVVSGGDVGAGGGGVGAAVVVVVGGCVVVVGGAVVVVAATVVVVVGSAVVVVAVALEDAEALHAEATSASATTSALVRPLFRTTRTSECYMCRSERERNLSGAISGASKARDPCPGGRSRNQAARRRSSSISAITCRILGN
jgi:hypothetical protein